MLRYTHNYYGLGHGVEIIGITIGQRGGPIPGALVGENDPVPIPGAHEDGKDLVPIPGALVGGPIPGAIVHTNGAKRGKSFVPDLTPTAVVLTMKGNAINPLPNP